MVPNKSRKLINVYIDGYNFYQSINNPELLHLGWCDLGKLATRLVTRAFGYRYDIGMVKYYTAKVDEHTRKATKEVERQALWLAALHHATNVWFVFGEFKKFGDRRRKEKRTDTNIAIGMVRDALVPTEASITTRSKPGSDVPAKCDAVLLVSGDDDLRPAIEMIANEYKKEAAVFWPIDAPPVPRSTARIVFDRVTKEDLEETRLDEEIRRASGSTIKWTEYLETRKEDAKA
jgi:hypothetical protein